MVEKEMERLAYEYQLLQAQAQLLAQQTNLVLEEVAQRLEEAPQAGFNPEAIHGKGRRSNRLPRRKQAQGLGLFDRPFEEVEPVFLRQAGRWDYWFSEVP